MAKYLPNTVTVTIESNGTKSTYQAAEGSISGNGDKYHPVLTVRLDNYWHKDSSPDVQEQPKEWTQAEKDEQSRKGHAQVLTGLLKAAETSALQGQIRLERLVAEMEQHKAKNRHNLMQAVNDAIQAGLSMEDVVADMRDDHAGYVSDMYDQVYVATDLDTVVNMD